MENIQENINELKVSYPSDSLGRRIGTVKNFYAYTDQMLLNMRSDLDLFMSLADLRFCRKHYADRAQPSITLSELYLLDEIIKVSRFTAKNSAVTELLTDNDDVRETYDDLFSKHSLLSGDNPFPLSLDTAALISSKYMNRIGVVCNGSIPASLRPTLERLSARPSSIAANTAFAIVTPLDDMEGDYVSAVEAFVSDEAVTPSLICAATIGSGGIATTLSSLANGIYADIYSIPDMSDTPELSYLATHQHGRIILAMPRQALPTLAEIAKRYQLSLSYFAKAVVSDKFTLLKRDRTAMQIDTSLIRALGSSLQRGTFDVSGENAKYFYSAVDTAVSAILPTVCRETERSRICLATEYTFPERTHESSLGGSLATVLGAYRVMCELCLADTPKIGYSEDEKISFSAEAYAVGQEIQIPDRFLSPDSYLYLLSFDRHENGLPDFASLRGMCDFYRAEVIARKVKSAKAIDGRLSDTIAEMALDYRFAPAENISDMLSKSFDGIVVESSAPMRIGILLGKVEPNGENNVN